MVKRRTWLLGSVAVVVAVAVGFGVRALSDPEAREIRRVEKRILALAEAVSFTEKDSPFLRLAYAEKLGGFFAPTTEVSITLGTREGHGTLTRAELTERAAAMRATARGLSVEFLDVAVTLNETKDGATAHLTSKIAFTGEPDYWVQELRLKLLKDVERGWLVERIGTVRTME